MSAAVAGVASDRGEWYTFSPGTLALGLSGGVVRIAFSPSPAQPDAYWCGAGHKLRAPSQANVIEFRAKSGSARSVGLKVYDSQGQIGQYNVDIPDDWDSVRLRRDEPAWLYKSSQGPLRDIAKVEFIFNNSEFKAGDQFVLEIKNLQFTNIQPKPHLHPNWMPKTIPPPVSGYRIETCIHNCWAKGVGEFSGLDSPHPETGLKLAREVADNLIAQYKYVGPEVAYLSGKSGENFARHVRARGGIALTEGHNNPGVEFLTQKNAFVINPEGKNPTQTGGLVHQTEDMTNPVVLAKLRERIEASAKVGAQAWRSVDYTWQWWGGPVWGYSESAIRRWRDDLTGRDTGLEIIEGGKHTVARFWRYFASYHGYTMKPKDLGLASWNDYNPPRRTDSPTPHELNSRRLFSMLYHYEWVKYINEAHRVSAVSYGCFGQPICNPECHDNGTDLYWLLKCAFIRGFNAEWWGSAGVVIPSYYNCTYYGNTARTNGKEIVLHGESAAAGNGFCEGSRPNYWDNMANYLITYAQSASVDFKAKHDQYWGASWKTMIDPKEKAYQAYTAFRSAWCGFLQCRNDKARKPETDVLAIGVRSVAYNVDPFDTSRSTQPFNLAQNLVVLNYLHDGAAFPIDDAYDLNRYNAILLSPFVMPQGFAAKVGAWVRSRKGRTLITHSFVPTRFSAPYAGAPPDGYAYLQSGGQERLLGLANISGAKIRAGVLEAHCPAFKAALRGFIGQRIEFDRGICESAGGTVLVSMDGYPLVTKRTFGKGRVIYIHFYPSNTSLRTRRLEAAVVDGVMRYVGCKPMAITPEGVFALVFDRSRGRKAVITYNSRARTDVLCMGRTCTVFQAQDPEVRGEVKALAGAANSRFLLKDVVTGQCEGAWSDSNGYVKISCDGWNMRGVYVDPLKSSSGQTVINCGPLGF